MNLALRHRLAPLWAGALAALLAGGVLAPAEARAGCSHYIVGQSEARVRSALADLEVLSFVRHDESAPTTPADRPLPCSGPSCKSQPSAPPLIPAPPHARAELWACLDANGPQANPHPSLTGAERRAVHPVHRSAPPVRPPRPLA